MTRQSSRDPSDVLHPLVFLFHVSITDTNTLTKLATNQRCGCERSLNQWRIKQSSFLLHEMLGGKGFSHQTSMCSGSQCTLRLRLHPCPKTEGCMFTSVMPHLRGLTPPRRDLTLWKTLGVWLKAKTDDPDSSPTRTMLWDFLWMLFYSKGWQASSSTCTAACLSVAPPPHQQQSPAITTQKQGGGLSCMERTLCAPAATPPAALLNQQWVR